MTPKVKSTFPRNGITKNFNKKNMRIIEEVCTRKSSVDDTVHKR